jgi:hypothetical protein
MGSTFEMKSDGSATGIDEKAPIFPGIDYNKIVLEVYTDL